MASRVTCDSCVQHRNPLQLEHDVPQDCTEGRVRGEQERERVWGGISGAGCLSRKEVPGSTLLERKEEENVGLYSPKATSRKL